MTCSGCGREPREIYVVVDEPGDDECPLCVDCMQLGLKAEFYAGRTIKVERWDFVEIQKIEGGP